MIINMNRVIEWKEKIITRVKEWKICLPLRKSRRKVNVQCN